MIPFVQLEAVFTDGSRLVTIHSAHPVTRSARRDDTDA